jgi:acyl-coenzyme A thioesterase PaaI-like protein
MNNFRRKLLKLEKLPLGLKKRVTNFVIGNTVKFVGTSGLKFEKLESNEVIVTLNNKRKVQNHIGQIHAAATTLLAETATGIILGLSIPDDKVPLMKMMNIQFVKRSSGAQTATAFLSNEQIEEVKNIEKGEINVPVKVTDESGNEVIVADIVWAWIPKKRI